ncbi:hypothetical protein B0A48_02481 [Cryoendolithus antarcticus]|uniref:2,6-dihydroxypyridine 3-monooxygenase substrate binding domain-containing protein n=1 Tax=Cryoendolithus antarcticus TaxID=1507870 RepID=A0A1V8TNR8_9PEZI|nr:hypothetical protein B0A48_02481 [Cryoendolithus antarcticus]
MHDAASATNGTNGNTNGHSNPLNIIGGSLAGLASGISLLRLGHKITILERNPTPLLQNQGAGIVAGGDTLAFFRQYDRCQRPFAVPSQKRMYLDREGKVVHEVAMKQAMTSWDLAYFVMRANFDGLESGYCDVPGREHGDGVAEYRYGCTFKKVEEAEGRVKVHFTDASGANQVLDTDLLIGADGPSSSVRKQFCPDVQRTTTGYCALRGTVPETEASDAALEVFRERFAFFHCQGLQILAYLIPGPLGNVEPGQRLVNFVWYYNFSSSELEELMTDADGKRHRYTLPPGKMSKAVWARLTKVAEDKMPPQFAEIVGKTKQPFAQAITDVISPTNSFLGGKVLLIGDALAGFRPHTVASTSQAAYDAMVLAEYVGGKKSHEEYVRETMQYGRLLQRRGVDMGTRSQYGADVPLEDHIKDRNLASTKREEEVYPEWTQHGLP